MYEKWIPFYPLIFIGLGVNRKFDDVNPFSLRIQLPAEREG